MANIFDQLQQEDQKTTTPAIGGNIFDQIHAEQQAATSAGAGWYNALIDPAKRAAQGALRGVGLPSNSAELKAFADEHNRQVEGILGQIKSGDYVGAAKSIGVKAVRDTFSTTPVGQTFASSSDQLNKAHTAMKEGRYQDALAHTGAATVPMGLLDPAANAIEDVRSGNVVGGVAQAAANIATLGAGAREGGLFERSTPGTFDKTPIGVELAPKPFKTQADAEAHFQSVSKPLIEVFSPSDEKAVQFQDNLRRAMPLVKETEGELGGPITRETLPKGIQIAIDRNRGQFRQYVDQARAMGKQIDGNVVADAMEASLSDKLKFENPDVYKNLQSEASRYRRTFTPDEFESFLETTNKQLHSFYKAGDVAQSAALEANARTSLLEAQAQGYRDALYGGVDPTGAGENIRELQKRYGSLASLRNETNLLAGKILKSPTLNTAQTAAANVGSAAKLLYDRKGAAMDIITKPKTVDDKISGAFRKLQIRTSPVPSPEFPVTGTPRQLGPGPVQVPPTDTTRMDVTTGRPLDQFDPVNLTHGEPAPTFNWQREQFPPNDPRWKAVELPSTEMQRLLFPKDSPISRTPNGPLGGSPTTSRPPSPLIGLINGRRALLQEDGTPLMFLDEPPSGRLR